MDDTLGAISAWEELIERYSANSKESELQNWVASALIHVAEATRKKIGDYRVGAAELINNVILSLFREHAIPDEIQYWVAAALIDKGRMRNRNSTDLEGCLSEFHGGRGTLRRQR